MGPFSHCPKNVHLLITIIFYCITKTAKGRGAEYAMDLLKNVEGLTLTLLTLPFVFSNFLGFFTPLPVELEGSANQWQISASLGDGENPIDMMSVTDLSVVVRKCLAS